MTRCRGRDRYEVGHPRRTAEFAATRTDSADTSRFLSCTDLTHLNADVEVVRQHLDELTEVNARFRNVVEDGFVSVTLVFNVSDLHVQTQLLRNLTRTDHGLLLQRLRLLPFLKVCRSCLAIDALDLEFLKVNPVLLHLHQHKTTHQRHFSYVVTRRRLHRYRVTLLQGNVRGV